MCWFRHDWKYHVHLIAVHAPPACREYRPLRTCQSCGVQQINNSWESDYPWQDIEPGYRVPVQQFWHS